MNKTKLLTLAFTVWGSMFASSMLLAHAGLAESNPGDKAVLNHSPENLEFIFSEEVRLLKVIVHDSSSMEVDTGFAPDSKAETLFSVVMPELSADTYTVEWTILGSDSHRVEGEFSFTYDPMAVATMGEHQAMVHDEH